MTFDNSPLTVDDFESLIWNSSSEHPLSDRLTSAEHASESILKEMSDETLAVALKKGIWTTKAFEELFAVRGKKCLCFWFFQWRVSFHDAQDLEQELFCRFWVNRLATYNPNKSFRAYLYQCARNLWLERARKREIPTVPETELRRLMDSTSPVNEAISRESQARIHKAIASLPEDERIVAELLNSGETPLTMVQKLGWELPKVYRVRFRARRFLEQQLAESPDSGDEGRF